MEGIKEPPPDVRPWYRILFGWVGLREVPWTGFGWILFAAIFYSVLLLVVFPEGFWEWLSTFLATFLSVLAAVFLYRHQFNRAEVERMYRMYMLMDADLEAMLMRIDPSRREMKPLSHLTQRSCRVHVCQPGRGPGSDVRGSCEVWPR